MKLKNILESGGYIKHSKPSSVKMNLPLSAYGNQPIVTFNKGDQDSAMGFWKDIISRFPKESLEYEDVEYLASNNLGDLIVSIDGERYTYHHVSPYQKAHFLKLYRRSKNEKGEGYRAIHYLRRQNFKYTKG